MEKAIGQVESHARGVLSKLKFVQVAKAISNGNEVVRLPITVATLKFDKTAKKNVWSFGYKEGLPEEELPKYVTALYRVVFQYLGNKKKLPICGFGFYRGEQEYDYEISFREKNF